MSVEAVQKLMDDTADAIEYQNVSFIWWQYRALDQALSIGTYNASCLQEIDEILSGNLTAEDEEDVLRELDELQQQEVSVDIDLG